MVACEYGVSNVVKLLIDAGADFNMKDKVRPIDLNIYIFSDNIFIFLSLEW